MRDCRLAAAAAVVLSLIPTSARAVKVSAGEDAWADARVLLQTWAQAREGGAADGKATGYDFFLRRARLVFFGNVTKDIGFFIETDSPNFGKGGNFSGSAYVQDAFASFTAAKELTVDTGLIIAPLTHHTFQGATTLNTVDYHSMLVKYPKDSNKVWRDVGVQLRGIAFDGRLQYRAAVLGGVRATGGRKDDAGVALPDLNPKSVPRVLANVRFNLLEPEPDFFLQGIYLGKRRVVSVGFAADHQPRAVAVGGRVTNYDAFGGDLFIDVPVGADQEAVFQTDILRYWSGTNASTSGTAAFVEAGYRFNRLEPVLSWERFFGETGASEVETFRVGLNWWFRDHTANLKAEIARERATPAKKRFADAPGIATATVQSQLYF